MSISTDDVRRLLEEGRAIAKEVHERMRGMHRIDSISDLHAEKERLRIAHESRRARVSLAISTLRGTFKLRPGCNNIEDAVADACAQHRALKGEPPPPGECAVEECENEPHAEYTFCEGCILSGRYEPVLKARREASSMTR